MEHNLEHVPDRSSSQQKSTTRDFIRSQVSDISNQEMVHTPEEHTTQDRPRQTEKRRIPHFGPPDILPPQKLERPQPPKEGSRGRLKDLPAYKHREKKEKEELVDFFSKSNAETTSILSSYKKEMEPLSAENKKIRAAIEETIGKNHSKDYQDATNKYDRELSILDQERERLLQLHKEIRENIDFINKGEFDFIRKEKIMKDREALTYNYKVYHKKRIQVFTEHNKDLHSILESLRSAD
jgi:hypothetical protein